MPLSPPKLVSKVDQGTRDGDWKICNHVTASRVEQHPSCDQSVEISSDYDGSLGVDVDDLVGFDVSWSYSVAVGSGSGDDFDVSPGQTGNLYASEYYRQYAVVTDDDILPLGMAPVLRHCAAKDCTDI